MSSSIDTLGESLVEATFQVFEESGAPLSESTRCEPVGDWLDPIAVIGFGGDSLRGSVSFEVPWRVLQATHPARSSATDELVDWAGELANLALGKLKTGLRRRAVGIQIGLPMTFTTHAAHAGVTSSPQLQYRLRAPDGSVLVRFSAELDADFAIAAPVAVDTVPSIELF